MEIKEIKAGELIPEKFIKEKVAEIRDTVRGNLTVAALSGGVDSSVTTVLGHKALGKNLKVIFVNNGLMREKESEQVVSTFARLGIRVEVIDAQAQFFKALKGIADPEKKREAITQTFYKDVFGKYVRKSGAKFLLQGTILTDIEETIAGIKRQHNVLEQMGIDPQKTFGYKIIEPLVEIRKDGVRTVAKELGLPASIWDRMPFPGPALAARVIGEVTPARIAIVRKATKIVEYDLLNITAFQCMAILHKDRVTGIKNGKREFGLQIEVRCWDSIDARTATPTEVPFDILKRMARRITNTIPEVVSVTYNIIPKPPSTMEAV